MESQSSVQRSILAAPRLAYSLAEAEIVGGLSRATLYRAIRTGELPSVRRGAGRRILRSDLEDFLKKARE